MRPFEDSDFTEARLEEVYESELANGLGNLVSRLTALCERFGVSASFDANGERSPFDLGRHIEDFRFDRAMELLPRLG